MKKGVIRRVDSLGRIVIPIHLRKILNINENDNIEMLINNDEELILKKYSTLKGSGDLFESIATALSEALKSSILIVDTEIILASAGEMRFSFRPKEMISSALIKMVKQKKNYHHLQEVIKADSSKLYHFTLFPLPLFSNEDGAIIVLKEQILNESEEEIIKSYLIFIANLLKE